MSGKTSLLKAGSLLFIGTMASNLCNYAFQIIMGRWLSVEDYGIMNSLFSLFMITTVPGLTITTVMAKYTSSFKAQQQEEKISGFFYGFLKTILFGLGLCFLIFLLLTPKICAYLKIPSLTPAIILGTGLFFGLLNPINLGVLQGFQYFGFFSLSIGFGSLLKLIFAAILVYLGFKVNGAMAALTLAGIVVFLATFFYMRKNGDILPLSKAKLMKIEDRQGIFKYSLPVLVASILFTVLTQVDMVLVKHYFSAQQAGLYASAAVLGRAVLYLPAAIILALFPMVAELHTLNQDSFHVLNKGLLYTALLAGAGVLLFWIIPDFLVTTFFGEKFLAAAPFLGVFGLAMFTPALLGIIINFNLARHQVKFIYPLLFFTIIQIGLIHLYHQTLSQVLWIMSGMGAIILITNLGMVLWEKNSAAQKIELVTRGCD